MFNDRLLAQCYSDHQKKFGGLKEDYFAEETAELTEPRILNGAQTIVTLHRLLLR